MRATLREALHAIGFRNIIECTNLEQTQEAVVIEPPDLLLLDLDRSKDDVCTLVRDIRHGKCAKDPFIVIMALTWKPHMDKVNSTMAAGIDDIVMMPVSMKILNDRIDKLIKKRKNFIVTQEYVGPNRRADNRADDELGAIDVPNRLRHKATGDEAAAASIEAVDEARNRVDHHLLNRYAQRIHALLDILTSENKEKENDQVETEVCLDEMGDIIQELKARINDNDKYGELKDICHSMEDLLALLRQGTAKRLFDLMRIHAHAVTATLMDQEGASDLIVKALEQATRQITAQSA